MVDVEAELVATGSLPSRLTIPSAFDATLDAPSARPVGASVDVLDFNGDKLVRLQGGPK